MKPRLAALPTYIEQTRQVLTQLGLDKDEEFKSAMAEVYIEFSGIGLACSHTTQELKRLSDKIHCQRMLAKLQSIVQSALGYYAIVAQTPGQNEPSIGSELGARILNQLHAELKDSIAIKNRIHHLLQKTK